MTPKLPERDLEISVHTVWVRTVWRMFFSLSITCVYLPPMGTLLLFCEPHGTGLYDVAFFLSVSIWMKLFFTNTQRLHTSILTTSRLWGIIPLLLFYTYFIGCSRNFVWSRWQPLCYMLFLVVTLKILSVWTTVLLKTFISLSYRPLFFVHYWYE